MYCVCKNCMITNFGFFGPLNKISEISEKNCDNEEPGQDVDGGHYGHNGEAGAVGHRPNGSHHCNVVQDEGKM